MSNKPILAAVETAAKLAPDDAQDFDSLWIDSELGDGITDTNYHTIPVGRPKDFFRLHPDKHYRRRTEIYTHKPEGMIDEQHYIIDEAMRGRIEEAQPCTLACVVYRDGSPRLWPLKLPKDGGHDNEAWLSARNGAKAGLTKWVKLVWVRRTFVTREAMPGYAPDPDWSKLPPFNELVKLAFGVHGIVRDTKHPIYRELFGADPKTALGDDDADL
jgi:hypothetical protein